MHESAGLHLLQCMHEGGRTVLGISSLLPMWVPETEARSSGLCAASIFTCYTIVLPAARPRCCRHPLPPFLSHNCLHARGHTLTGKGHDAQKTLTIILSSSMGCERRPATWQLELQLSTQEVHAELLPDWGKLAPVCWWGRKGQRKPIALLCVPLQQRTSQPRGTFFFF